MKQDHFSKGTILWLEKCMVLLTFTFSNILILIALAKSVFTYYPQIMTKSSTGDFIRIDACTG